MGTHIEYGSDGTVAWTYVNYESLTVDAGEDWLSTNLSIHAARAHMKPYPVWATRIGPDETTVQPIKTTVGRSPALITQLGGAAQVAWLEGDTLYGVSVSDNGDPEFTLAVAQSLVAAS